MWHHLPVNAKIAFGLDQLVGGVMVIIIVGLPVVELKSIPLLTTKQCMNIGLLVRLRRRCRHDHHILFNKHEQPSDWWTEL